MEGSFRPIEIKSVEHLLSIFIGVQLDNVHNMWTACVVWVININKITRLVYSALKYKIALRKHSIHIATKNQSESRFRDFQTATQCIAVHTPSGNTF